MRKEAGKWGQLHKVTPLALDPHKSYTVCIQCHTNDMKNIPFRISPFRRHLRKAPLYRNVAFHIDRPYCLTQSRAFKSLFHFHLRLCGWWSIRGNFPTKSRREWEMLGEGSGGRYRKL